MTIFEEYESGVTGSWVWEAVLSVHLEGGFSIDLQQVLWDSDEDAEPSNYTLERFSTGRELFEFLQHAWIIEHQEPIDSAMWHAIAENVRPYHNHLADQILDRLNEE